MKRYLWTALSLVLLAGMGHSIFKVVTSDSPTTPRPPDVQMSQRILVPPAGEAQVPDLRDPVITAAASTTTATRPVGGNGIVEPDGEELPVAGQAAGRIAQVLVHEGQLVKEGEVLIQLVDAVERAAVEVARADLEVARARLDKIVAGSRAEDVRRVVAEAREADARAAVSRGVYERLEKLAASEAATADELERARGAAAADRYAASAAQARRATVVNGNRAEDITEVRAEVAAAEARLAETQARLDERRIAAPRAGEVLQVRVRPGGFYQPGGEAPVVMGDTSHLLVRVDVDERDFAKIAVGAKVKVLAKAFGERVFEGKVRELGRKMGRKNVRTDDPTERNDTKILEVLVALDSFEGLIVGQRVVALIEGSAEVGRL